MNHCEPREFEDRNQPNAACILHRSLYGLKQSPRCWNSKFTEFLTRFNFRGIESDHCVFSGKVSEVTAWLALYVNDGLLLSASKDAIAKVLENLKACFEIKIGDAKNFVSIEITRDRESRTIKISQKMYIEKLLRRFRMEEANPVSVPAEPGLQLLHPQNSGEEFKAEIPIVPYREAVGSLLFAARVTRPDIEFAVNKVSQFVVNKVSQFVENYRQEQWQAVKRIFRYLKGTKNYGIVFGNNNGEFNLKGYTDADYAGFVNTRKSTSGFVFMLSSGAIAWSSQKQSVVALSTTEAEYIALSNGTKDGLWLRQITRRHYDRGNGDFNELHIR